MQDTPRPLYHFTSPDDWINDPNGLVYHDGEYHLFYQYRTQRHWGHAVSRDLVRWEHLPVAIAPDTHGDIWSGSVVVDADNTSGYFPDGRDGMVAMFTHHKGSLQDQNINYSTDRGRSWTWPMGVNPVVPNPGRADFRDPKVLWHAPSGRWSMLVSGGDRLMFYTSPDLTHWTPAGTFKGGQPMPGAIWECPDLFRVPIEGRNGESRWVLLASYFGPPTFAKNAVPISPGTVYFIGEFDGNNFVCDHITDGPLRTAWGPDDYAAITWNDAPHGRSIALGWMNNWLYADRLPTMPWKGQMTLPREQVLRQTAQGLRLINKPVPEINAMILKTAATTEIWLAEVPMPLRDDAGYEVRLLTVGLGDTGVRIKLGSTCEVFVGVSDDRTEFTIDRRGPHADPIARFDRITTAPRRCPTAPVSMLILIDRCSVELFGDDGETYMAAHLLPADLGEKATAAAINGSFSATLFVPGRA